jgi:hypothetical protein
MSVANAVARMSPAECRNETNERLRLDFCGDNGIERDGELSVKLLSDCGVEEPRTIG